MAVISVTRLRLASVRHLPGFVWHTTASLRQARHAPGFAGVRVLADRRLTFWTATAWDDLASMKAYRNAAAHRRAMGKLSRWCDEASVVRWTGDAGTLDDWTHAHARMVADGQVSHVLRPSPAQSARAWPPPRLWPAQLGLRAARAR